MSFTIPVLGAGVPHESRHARLRSAISGPAPVVVPGVFDAITARLAELAGVDACYLTGAGLANTQLGVPDIGLVGAETLIQQAGRMAAVTSLPIIVDCDTGFGGPTSVMNLVRSLETVGVSGIQIEDQQMPKRCGHFDHKRLVSKAEMQAKVEAATMARRSEDLVVIARTDAIATEGLDSALDRAAGYREAGADVIFVEAPEDLKQVRAIPLALPDVPLVMNIVPGGKTPELSVRELGDLGYAIHLHANLLLRSMIAAGRISLEALVERGRRAEELPFLSWSERQALVRLDEFDALEDALFQKWGLEEAQPVIVASSETGAGLVAGEAEPWH